MSRSRIASTLLIALAALPLAACDIDQTEEGELPEISVEGGNLPEYDVDAAEVNIGTTQDTVVIEKPVVDVDLPDDDTSSSH